MNKKEQWISKITCHEIKRMTPPEYVQYLETCLMLAEEMDICTDCNKIFPWRLTNRELNRSLCKVCYENIVDDIELSKQIEIERGGK